MDREVLEMLAEGRVKYSRQGRLRLGRLILKRRLGVLVGREGEAEGQA